MPPCPVFGLTGGIGSGKSTVARRFRERGLPVLDADELSREVLSPASQGLLEVARAFGQGVILPNGELDRKKLAEHAFGDPKALATLNAIVHPRVRQLAQARFQELALGGEPLACYEVPLLFEVGLESELRPVVVVTAPEELQIARAVRRQGFREEDVRVRLRAQLPLAEKKNRADYVIDNSGDLAHTRKQADAVLDAICGQFAIPIDRYPV